MTDQVPRMGPQSLMATNRQNPQMGNFDAANAALGMNAQEQALYLRHLANLWGNGGVNNPDGSRSTLFQANMQGPNGQAYNVPTVYNGSIITDPAAIRAQTDAQGWGTFPSYPTQDAAESRYQQMHDYMNRDTGDYMNVRHAPLRYGGGLF